MKCSNWGNPLSEIYLEALRYFSGETSATAAFATNNSEPAGSSVENTWVDPIESDEWCVNCSVIVLSTGTNSFDGDDLGTLTDLPGLTEAKLDSNFTDSIGNAEQGGIFSGNYFIGESASSALEDSTCTTKYLTNLSDARGICSELPALEGTYDIAGLAYYAKTEDIRDSIAGEQNVSTYTVDLAESLPTFRVPVGTGEISFLPICQANPYGTWQHRGSEWNFWLTCSVFDVQIEFIENDSAGKPIKGSYIFYWEDSQFGSDYDLDVSQRIRFCVGSSCNGDDRFECPKTQNGGQRDSNCSNRSLAADEIKIISTAASAQAGNNIKLGYALSGTQVNDGPSDLHLRPGVNTNNYSYSAATNFSFKTIADEDEVSNLIEYSGRIIRLVRSMSEVNS